MNGVQSKRKEVKKVREHMTDKELFWIVNTFLDNFFKVVLPVLYRGLIS